MKFSSFCFYCYARMLCFRLSHSSSVHASHEFILKKQADETNQTFFFQDIWIAAPSFSQVVFLTFCFIDSVVCSASTSSLFHTDRCSVYIVSLVWKLATSHSAPMMTLHVSNLNYVYNVHCVYWKEIHINPKTTKSSANLHNWLSVNANIFTCSCLATQCCIFTRLLCLFRLYCNFWSEILFLLRSYYRY